MTDLARLEADLQELRELVRDLVEVFQEHVRETERLATRLEQQTSLRDRPRDLPVVASRVAELSQRAHKLAQAETAQV